jgi:hypothetical protein
VSLLRKLATLPLAALALLPGAALGQTSSEVAAAWGLLGSWQVECGGALGNSNPVYSYRANGARIVLDRKFGVDLSDSNMVSGVRRGANGEILYTVTFASADPPQSREHVVVKTPDGKRMRVYSNRNPDTGQYAVRDGKFTDDGTTTPWFNRCQ